MEAQNASIQLVHASDDVALATVDIYLNGELAYNDVAFQAATPFIAVSANTPVTITVAPGNSVSAAESVLTLNQTFDAQQPHCLAIFGQVGSAEHPLSVVDDTTVLLESEDLTQVQIGFCHLATDAPAFDMVLRNSGQMIAGNLAFGAQTPYAPFAEADHYIDIKATGTASIFSTVRLSLQGFAGQAARVFMTGSTTTPTSLRLFAVFPSGVSLPLDYAPLGRVQFVNALTDTVDVFKNGTRFSDNTLPGRAMPFKNIPAGLPMSIAVTAFSNSSINVPQPPYGTFQFEFANTQTYLAVSAGRRGDQAHPLTLFFAEGTQEKASNGDEVALCFFNAAYNHPSLQLMVIGETAMTAAAYGTASAYQNVEPLVYQALLADASGAPVSDVFALHLDTLGGEVLHLVATYNKFGAPEVWGVTSNGVSTRLYGNSSATGTLAANWQVSLTPNPATDHLRLAGVPNQSGRVQIAVLNQQGQFVYRQQQYCAAQTAFATSIDTNSWPSGLYCLTLRTDLGQMFTTKFSIAR